MKLRVAKWNSFLLHMIYINMYIFWLCTHCYLVVTMHAWSILLSFYLNFLDSLLWHNWIQFMNRVSVVKNSYLIVFLSIQIRNNLFLTGNRIFEMQRTTRAAPTTHNFQQVFRCINHDIFINGGEKSENSVVDYTSSIEKNMQNSLVES